MEDQNTDAFLCDHNGDSSCNKDLSSRMEAEFDRNDTKRFCSSSSQSTDNSNMHHRSIEAKMLSPLYTGSVPVASVADTMEMLVPDCGKRKRHNDPEISRDGTTSHSTNGTSTIDDEYSTPEVTFARMISEVSQQSLSQLVNCKEPPLQSQATALQYQSEVTDVASIMTTKRHVTIQQYDIDKSCSRYVAKVNAIDNPREEEASPCSKTRLKMTHEEIMAVRPEDAARYRYQADPCQADPVDFDDGRLHRHQNHVRTFLIDLEQAHEEQLQYNRRAPDMNANNFSWVLQHRNNSTSSVAARSINQGTGSNCHSKIIESYEQPLIRLLQRKDELTKEIPVTHRVILLMAYHHTTKECVADHIRWQGYQRIPPTVPASEFFSTDLTSPTITETLMPLDGTIYTSFNPFSFHKARKTDQCILVLQLTVVPKKRDDNDGDKMLNSIQALPSSDYGVPIMKFPSDLIETLLYNYRTGSHVSQVGNDMVFKYHSLLQSIVDKHWNTGPTVVPIATPSKVHLCNYYDVRYHHHRQSISSMNPELPTSAYTLQYAAPETPACQSLVSMSSISPHWECAICLSHVSNDSCSTSKKYDHGTAALLNCSHMFHRHCIDECFRQTYKYTCPLCRTPLPKRDDGPRKNQKYHPKQHWIGSMPSGLMQIEVCHDLFADPDPNAQHDQKTCDGVICIVNRFPSGIQKGYHPFPLRRYDAATFITYLPNNTAGREVLERMQYAFAFGHLFTIQPTATGGIAPVLSNNTCHHIDPHPHTSHLAFSPFSIHDAGTRKNRDHNEYLKNIHADLDQFGIPTMEQILEQ